jgi:hypothetical protein
MQTFYTFNIHIFYIHKSTYYIHNPISYMHLLCINMLRIALGLCTGIMHNIHKNIHKADAYFSASVIIYYKTIFQKLIRTVESAKNR